MLNFFKKKKEPDYDVTDLKITDLNVGFIFEYDMKSWVVKEKYEYQWNTNNFSYEYKIDSGDDLAFLSVEDEGVLKLAIFRPMKIRKIDEDVADEISRTEKAPRQIHYNGEQYFLNSDTAGHFRECGKKTEDWEELVAFEYLNEEETQIISISQWDEETFEASEGIAIEPYQISNIIPGS